ncbi:MAG: beta-ketoacyl synthase chain length factor [Dokdonella sp.]
MTVFVTGIGFWARGLPDWPAAVAALTGNELAPSSATRPTAALLPAGERRRAPESVLLACEVAGQACAAAGLDPAALPSVFASNHGDMTITDAICATLAENPLETSPIKFHNSVHNAASGYWTIANECRAPSMAISAGPVSFAAGLFEAAVQACGSQSPVLLAAYDVPAPGPLRDIARHTEPFGVAFVLAADDSHGGQRLRLRMNARVSKNTFSELPPSLQALAEANDSAACLPLLAALANKRIATIELPAGTGTSLTIEVGHAESSA